MAARAAIVACALRRNALLAAQLGGEFAAQRLHLAQPGVDDRRFDEVIRRAGARQGLRGAQAVDGAVDVSQRGPRLGLRTQGAQALAERFFEVDTPMVVLATLTALLKRGLVARETVAGAIKDLGIDPEKAYPVCL